MHVCKLDEVYRCCFFFVGGVGDKDTDAINISDLHLGFSSYTFVFFTNQDSPLHPVGNRSKNYHPFLNGRGSKLY